MQGRHQKLRDALRLQQFFRDIEDEVDWIKEKDPIASSTSRGVCVWGGKGVGVLGRGRGRGEGGGAGVGHGGVKRYGRGS